MCQQITEKGKKCKNNNLLGFNVCRVHAKQQKGGLKTKRVCKDTTSLEYKEQGYEKIVKNIETLINPNISDDDALKTTLKLTKNINKIELESVPLLLAKDIHDVLKYVIHKVVFSEKQLQLIEEIMENIKKQKLEILEKEINKRAFNTFESISKNKNFKYSSYIPPEIVDMIKKY